MIRSPVQVVFRLYWPCALVVALPQAEPSAFFAVTVAPLTGPLTAEPEMVV